METKKQRETRNVHVADYKKKVVKDIVKLMKEYPIIGAINMENMPAPQLQIMRAKLRDKVKMVMTKRRFIKIAIDEVGSAKKGIDKLKDSLKGMPALMFTKENPFSLYKTIKQNKSPAPAKEGQTAPRDIVVTAGATPFAPGPIISELGSVGIKAGVEGGKVVIKQDCVVVKEGQKVSDKVASMLLRLGMTPMEIGLDLTAVYEDGVIYDRKVLDIDEDKFKSDMSNAARWAFNLAVESGYCTKETINLLIQKSFREAKAAAVEANILNDSTKDEILAKAERQALSLKSIAKTE